MPKNRKPKTLFLPLVSTMIFSTVMSSARAQPDARTYDVDRSTAVYQNSGDAPPIHMRRPAHWNHAWSSNQKPVSGARALTIDASNEIGTIKDLSGVNGAAKSEFPGYPDVFRQYAAIGVGMVRTHDFYGPTDIDASYPQNSLGLDAQVGDANAAKDGDIASRRVIFLDPNANADDPKSYNFAATDLYIQSLIENGQQIYYRIGRSEGGGADAITDPAKYAKVVAHIAMHYNQGWDHGFHDGIKYWEFWNEPDLVGYNWTGTADQFYTTYDSVARALKAVDSSYQVGADGLCLPINPSIFRDGLIEHVAANHTPLDFFSFHNYPSGSQDPYDAIRQSVIDREFLDSNGLTKTKLILSEWNSDPYISDDDTRRTQSIQNAAFIESSLIYMLDSPIDQEFYYRGDTMWLGLFSGAHGKFTNAARALLAWNAMKQAPIRLAVSGPDHIGFATVAGLSRDHRTMEILISNDQIDRNFLSESVTDTQAEATSSTAPLTDREKLTYFGTTDIGALKNLNPREFPATSGFPANSVGLSWQTLNYSNNAGYDLTIKNLPWGLARYTIEKYRLDQDTPLQLTDVLSHQSGAAHIVGALPPPGIELIVLHASDPVIEFEAPGYLQRSNIDSVLQQPSTP